MDFAKIRPRGGTKAQWETTNPVLGKREMGVQWESEIGVGKVVIKFGNGITAWNNLDTAVEVENDLVNKIISSIVTVSDEYPILNDGDSLSTLVGKIKKYIQDLKDKKLDKSARYDGTDSTSTELVPTANALRGVNAKADKNASDITTINNNLSNTDGRVTQLYSDMQAREGLYYVRRGGTSENVQFKPITLDGQDGMIFTMDGDTNLSVNVWKNGKFGSQRTLATKDDLLSIDVKKYASGALSKGAQKEITLTFEPRTGYTRRYFVGELTGTGSNSSLVNVHGSTLSFFAFNTDANITATILCIYTKD